MSCDHCVAAVTAEVTKIYSVISVDVDLTSGNVQITSDQHIDRPQPQELSKTACYHVNS